MRVSPHLNFNGNCRAAFEHYQAVFGGTIKIMLTYGESPLAATYDARLHALILHAALEFGDTELMGTDQPPDAYQAPQGFHIALLLPTAQQARSVFEALAAGGSVTLPFQTTFWTAGFGMLVDTFGIPWEINTDQPPT